MSIITDFDEIAIRAPRPGFFVGDKVENPPEYSSPTFNPIVKQFDLHYDMPLAPKVFPLGSLTRFPVEILHEIMLHMDVLTVLEFRNINQRFCTIVDSSREFIIVVSFPKALSAFFFMGCKFFTLKHVATSLIGTRCSRCKAHFGELLYLVTADRVCWPCWRRFRQYIPKTTNIGLPKDVLIDRIPHIIGLSGLYGHPHFSRVAKPGPIFDRSAVNAELEKSCAAIGKSYFDSDPEPERMRLRNPTSTEEANSLARKLEVPKAIRYIAFLRAPYFDDEVQEYVGGYFCRACTGHGISTFSQRYNHNWEFPEAVWHEPWSRYTRMGFREHIEKYGQILKNEIDGTYSHDSSLDEVQTPDDVQWEMQDVAKVFTSKNHPWRDDRPIPYYSYGGRPICDNCQ